MSNQFNMTHPLLFKESVLKYLLTFSFHIYLWNNYIFHIYKLIFQSCNILSFFSRLKNSYIIFSELPLIIKYFEYISVHIPIIQQYIKCIHICRVAIQKSINECLLFHTVKLYFHIYSGKNKHEIRILILMWLKISKSRQTVLSHFWE